MKLQVVRLVFWGALGLSAVAGLVVCALLLAGIDDPPRWLLRAALPGFLAALVMQALDLGRLVAGTSETRGAVVPPRDTST